MSTMTKQDPKPAAPAPRWFDIKAAGADSDVAELHIYGDIGHSWDEHSVTAADLVAELADITASQIHVRINSYGGSVPDGMAIYNALKRHNAAVHVYVDGVAISCASYIAMAGETVTMAQNAQMMIHAPWGVSVGNAQEMREQAEVLDRFAKAMAHAYASKSGKSYDEALALISDGKDHWFLADEAVAAGFADTVSDPVAVAASLARQFDLSRFSTTPTAARAASTTKERPTMKDETQQVATPEAAATPATQPPAAAYARDKAANEHVLATFRPLMHMAGMQELQTECLADPSLTLDTIRAKILAKMGEGAAPAMPPTAAVRIETVADAADKQRDAMVQALLVKAGVQDKEAQDNIRFNPYRAYTLLEMARASLERAGIDMRGKDKMQVVAAAITQGTGDFPILLENAMHKTLQSAYASVALTWSRFCATGSVSDFRAHNRYRVGSFGDLDAVNELGEFINKSIPDGEKASITATTKGNVINLSRQAIINDDLGAFTGMAAMLGRAAARSVENDVYALLNANSGMGPTMADTNPLFHVSRNNVAADGDMSVTTIDDARVKMASQLDVGGNDYLDLRPAVLVCSTGSGGTARVINSAEYDPDTSGKLQRPNMVRGLFSDVVDSPRVAGNSGKRFYLFADPTLAPVFEVAFLDGNQTPFLDFEQGFDVDGSRWKVRLDYGVGVIDYRGAVTAKGSS